MGNLRNPNCFSRERGDRLIGPPEHLKSIFNFEVMILFIALMSRNFRNIFIPVENLSLLANN